MRDMTFSDWDAHLGSLQAQVQTRWADLEVAVHKSSLSVKMRDCMSGDVRLERGSADFMVPRVRIGSSVGMPLELSLAQAQLNDMARVMDALHFVHAACDGMRVFRDGECPCSRCSTKGKTRDGECDACGGEGFR